MISKNLFVFGDDGKVTYKGPMGIMAICIENEEIRIDRNSESDGVIVIPASVISKLILNYDKQIIQDQLKTYLDKA